jgi:Na+/melibiose symporter-like transporter
VLLLQDEALSSAITALIVIGSLFCYPLLRPLTGWLGKRWLGVVAFAWLGLVLAAVAWFGRLPLGAATQAYLLGLLAAFPAAVITAVLPAAVTDVARFHGNQTGESLEGMFVATAIFLQKLGRSLGLLLFAALATLGRDVGDDAGIRAAAILAGGCSLLAAVLMMGYRSAVIESGAQASGSASALPVSD